MIGRLLGIDYGLKRIGLAVSDANGIVARELMILHRRSKREDFAEIAAIVEREQIVAFVVGLPVSYDAPEGVYTQADRVRNWVKKLVEVIPLPFVLWNEYLTSEEARELAREIGRNPREAIDDLAARIVLQTYLDALRDGLATPPQR
ncbi:MAG: Holliday junction resolvase RuvX [Chloroflexi bacterium]|nr:MAG: Holliday junction resolvase RuvX [Chloroflexota bacterium]